jgi:hypothetical protein
VDSKEVFSERYGDAIVLFIFLVLVGLLSGCQCVN